MKKEDCFQLGRITRLHGLRGEMQWLFDADDPAAYADLDRVFIEQKGELVPYFIESLNIQPTRIIARLEGIATLEAATPLVGSGLWLPDEDLPELEDGQFYFHEVVGAQVHEAGKGLLGTVKEVVSTGYQDLLVVMVQGREVLIPIVDDIVGDYDATANRIDVTLPEGLLDVYLNDDPSSEK